MTNETEEQRNAKRQEWMKVIESDPELFIALAEVHPATRRMIAEIRQADNERNEYKISAQTNSSERIVSRDEALQTLASLDKTQYRRNDVDFQSGAGTMGYVSGNIPVLSLVKLVEYARQQVVNNSPDLFVLQDSRSTVDNKMLFWRRDAKGYTTHISDAHRFTEAEAQQANRATDIPHRVGDLNPASQDILDQAAQVNAPKHNEPQAHHAAKHPEFEVMDKMAAALSEFVQDAQKRGDTKLAETGISALQKHLGQSPQTSPADQGSVEPADNDHDHSSGPLPM
jgi:hypothetical protein